MVLILLTEFLITHYIVWESHTHTIVTNLQLIIKIPNVAIEIQVIIRDNKCKSNGIFIIV